MPSAPNPDAFRKFLTTLGRVLSQQGGFASIPPKHRGLFDRPAKTGPPQERAVDPMTGHNISFSKFLTEGWRTPSGVTASDYQGPHPPPPNSWPRTYQVNPGTRGSAPPSIGREITPAEKYEYSVRQANKQIDKPKTAEELAALARLLGVLAQDF